MTRARGFKPWSPQKETLVLLEQVGAVLEEYDAFLPLTIRQVFYNLVTRFEYDKTEKAYARLCEMLNRARRAGCIPFEHIRDDGGSSMRPSFWQDPDDFRRACEHNAKKFKLDRQRGQSVRLWLLCESGGMVPMLYRAAATYGLPVLSSGGFDSLTAKHDLAQELANANCSCEILHIGDLDPSGVHLFTSLAEDITAMAASLTVHVPKFTRLAVKREQIAQMGLQTAPPKKSDRRSFSGATTQAEAIPPNVLTSLVISAIEERQSTETRKAVLEAETNDRSELIAWIMDAREDH